MKKILAFGASNSKNSINQQLAQFALESLEGVEGNLIDLNDFEMPLYGIDREQELGIPDLAQAFKELIRQSDGIIISFAEHNGSYTVAFKNVFDWVSRVERSIWLDKPMFLLATSPGGRGGKSVLDYAVNDFPHRGGNVVAHFSLPSFNQNFSAQDGVLETALKNAFDNQLQQFKKAVVVQN